MKLTILESTHINQVEFDNALEDFRQGRNNGFEITYFVNDYTAVIFYTGNRFYLTFYDAGSEIYKTTSPDEVVIISRLNKFCLDNNLQLKFDRIKTF